MASLDEAVGALRVVHLKCRSKLDECNEAAAAAEEERDRATQVAHARGGEVIELRSELTKANSETARAYGEARDTASSLMKVRTVARPWHLWPVPGPGGKHGDLAGLLLVAPQRARAGCPAVRAAVPCRGRLSRALSLAGAGGFGHIFRCWQSSKGPERVPRVVWRNGKRRTQQWSGASQSWKRRCLAARTT